MDKLTNSPCIIILGSWTSNKEKTMNEPYILTRENPDQVAAYNKALGRIKCRYTDGEIFHGYEDENNKTTYEILWEDERSIFIVSSYKSEKKAEWIHFSTPNDYWVQRGSFREWFARDSAQSGLATA